MKLSFKLLFLFLISTALIGARSMDVILAPAERGKKSKIIPVDEFEEMIEEDRYTYDYLMYYNMGGDTASHYTWTECQSKFADSFTVWFKPPAACSILKGRIYCHNYFDSLNTLYATAFVTKLDQSIDYYNDFKANWLSNPCDSAYPYSPVDSTYREIQYELPGGSWQVFNLVVNLDPPVDNAENIFGVGYFKENPALKSPNPAFWVNFSGASLPTHSISFGDTACAPYPGWYKWYNYSYGVPFCAFAYVRLYSNPSPEFVACENQLNDTYSTTARTVNMHVTDYGLPPDSSGIDMSSVVIKYEVNSGTANQVAASFVRGDSTDAYFVADIPGQSPGDTVVYWGEATDIQGATGYGIPGSYVIRQGEPGDFLYIRDDYKIFDGGDIAAILPDYYEDTVDVWDTKIMGDPDESVFEFYSTGPGYPAVVIRSWAVGFFNNVDCGMADDSTDLNYPCSTYVKNLLDNGGCFWLSDQDMGVGFGVWPPHFHHMIIGWVRNYLGIQGVYDDDPQLAGKVLTVYPVENPLIDDLFSGIGYQNPGEIKIAPYVYFDSTLSWSSPGSYDSLFSGVIRNMQTNGKIISYAWENPNNNSKVWMDYWPFDYIVNPADSTHIDTTAVDTLVFDVLDWFGIGRTGVGEEVIEPDDIIKLYPVGLIGENALIKFYLPDKQPVNLSIYDNTGRKIKKLVNRSVRAGLNAANWNCLNSKNKKVPSGIYFVSLKTEDNRLTQKIVVLR